MLIGIQNLPDRIELLKRLRDLGQLDSLCGCGPGFEISDDNNCLRPGPAGFTEISEVGGGFGLAIDVDHRWQLTYIAAIGTEDDAEVKLGQPSLPCTRDLSFSPTISHRREPESGEATARYGKRERKEPGYSSFSLILVVNAYF